MPIAIRTRLLWLFGNCEGKDYDAERHDNEKTAVKQSSSHVLTSLQTAPHAT